MPDYFNLAAVKARLGVRSNHRDEELQALIPAAVGQVEDLSQHILVRRSVTQFVPRFPASIGLHVWPVVAVEEVSYLDAAGAKVVIPDARLIIDGPSARVFPAAGSAWPVPGSPSGIRVKVLAGYDPAAAEGTEDAVPMQLVQAVMLLIGHWFENHEATVVGTSAVELPLGVRDICSQFRIPGLS